VDALERNLKLAALCHLAVLAGRQWARDDKQFDVPGPCRPQTKAAPPYIDSTSESRLNGTKPEHI
jgi:hypothetical protein